MSDIEKQFDNLNPSVKKEDWGNVWKKFDSTEWKIKIEDFLNLEDLSVEKIKDFLISEDLDNLSIEKIKDFFNLYNLSVKQIEKLFGTSDNLIILAKIIDLKLDPINKEILDIGGKLDSIINNTLDLNKNFVSQEKELSNLNIEFENLKNGPLPHNTEPLQKKVNEIIDTLLKNEELSNKKEEKLNKQYDILKKRRQNLRDQKQELVKEKDKILAKF